MYCPKCGAQNDESFKFCKTCGNDLTATLPLDAAQSGPPELSEIDLVRQELREEYEILEELGRGGMAIVFRAKESQLDREVAIKVLPFSLAFDKEFVERFQREARTAAKLEHPSIIPIYRVGKSGRVIYFVMKFLRGKPLSAVLASRGALSPPEIRGTLIQVARALAYAHRSGIVHRDIKPDNIMFDEHGQAIVTDFGIAKAATGGKLTGTGMAIGTPHYMSPEQARAQQLDGRSDIYSLGVVAYQCLSGVVPFDGEDSFSIGYKHIMEELPVPRLEAQDQRDLFEVVRKMMAKVPDERFQTADELVEVLESGATGYVAMGISTAQTRSIPSLSGIPRVSTQPTTPLPRLSTTARPQKSTMSALVLWVLAVAVLLGGPGYYAYRKGLIFAKSPADSTAHADTSALAADDTAGKTTDTTSHTATTTPVDTGRPANVPAGAPGKLVLQGVPVQGARVTVDGQIVRGTQFDLPPGTHRLTVRAPGFVTFDRQVLITPGATNSLPVTLEREAAAQGTGGGCDEPGPAYNQDGICFDTRPQPLSAPIIFLAPDATETPREAILNVKVSPEGESADVRVVLGSNVPTFTDRAVDFARSLRWNPAQKNGEPVIAWTQLRVIARRQ
jgi:serine/threonine-protein kinase